MNDRGDDKLTLECTGCLVNPSNSIQIQDLGLFWYFDPIQGLKIG